VVDQLVHVAPQHLFGAPTQGLAGGAIHKGAEAAHIDAENPLAGAFQQQREPACGLFGSGRRVGQGKRHAHEGSKLHATDWCIANKEIRKLSFRE
jgi:hypothetical protein